MNLGNLYFNLDRLQEAESLEQRCLAIKRRSLGPDHPDLADVYYNMADGYVHRGRIAEAERTAIEIIREWSDGDCGRGRR